MPGWAENMQDGRAPPVESCTWKDVGFAVETLRQQALAARTSGPGGKVSGVARWKKCGREWCVRARAPGEGVWRGFDGAEVNFYPFAPPSGAHTTARRECLQFLACCTMSPALSGDGQENTTYVKERMIRIGGNEACVLINTLRGHRMTNCPASHFLV